jgi:hypothetical protein
MAHMLYYNKQVTNYGLTQCDISRTANPNAKNNSKATFTGGEEERGIMALWHSNGIMAVDGIHGSHLANT